MVDSHILLLPKDNYFDWVRATVKYVLAFGVSITPDPKKATQKDNITVVVVPGAYAQYGDIVEWLEERHPQINIDPVRVSSPDELRNVLQKRVAAGLQLGNVIGDELPDSDNGEEVIPDELKVINEIENVVKEPNTDISDDGLSRMGEVEKEHGTPRHEVIEDTDINLGIVEPDKDELESLSIGKPFRLKWPTDYPKVTQLFAANPEIYSKWGLPGHEGVDIRAPMNTNIYAAADGDVYFLTHEATGHPYGKHIRIRHRDGYRTVYGHLASVGVEIGQKVSAGQLIGKANSTGNSSGSHLHLTLKKEGATARKETQFKGDVIDPTPFLIYPHDSRGNLRTLNTEIQYPWNRSALVGINVRDDGFMHDADFDVVHQAHIEAVKIQENTPTKAIQRLKMMRNDMFIVARLSFDLGQTLITSAEWAARIMPDMLRLYDLGIRYYEIHQSPNLQSFGWNYTWHSGGGFARWWLDIVHRLKDRYPDAKFGFPGVSPGGQVEGQRLDSKTFMEQADDAIHVADWVGANCFWSNNVEIEDEEKGAFYKFVRRRFPDKLIFVTEFGNVNVLTDSYVKGNEYAAFYQNLRNTSGVGAVFSQVMSSPKGYDGMQWRLENGELTRIPIQVGKRSF